MFLLFGVRTRDDVVERRMTICEVCGHEAPQTLVRRTTKFTLFFVPLFPVRPSRSYLECAHCWAVRPAVTAGGSGVPAGRSRRSAA